MINSWTLMFNTLTQIKHELSGDIYFNVKCKTNVPLHSRGGSCVKCAGAFKIANA